MSLQTLDADTLRFGRLLHYVGLLAAVVFGTAGYSCVYVPLTDSILDAATHVDQLTQSMKNTSIVRREHAKLTDQLAEIDRRYRILCDRVPVHADAGEFLHQVGQIAQRVQLSIDNFQPQKSTNRDGFAEMEVTLSGQGSFTAICSFFDQLSKMTRLSKVQDLHISASPDSQSYPVKATLVIYFGLKSEYLAQSHQPRGQEPYVRSTLRTVPGRDSRPLF